jgi:hypothetical protein
MLLKKHLWLATLLLGLLLTTACNDDEEPGIPEIVATWNFSSLDFDIKINDKPLLDFLINDLDYPPAEAAALEAFLKASIAGELPLNNSTITFKADGTYEVKENGTVQDSGTYELNAAKTILKLTSGGVTDEVEVLELNQARLVIKFSEVENDDITEDGIPEKVQVNVTVRFTK